MPAPVVQGFITFLEQQLGVTLWDGEIPRYDTSGNPINPDVTVSPAVWPVMTVKMTEQGLDRLQTIGADPYDETGPLLVECYGTTREQLEDPNIGLLNRIDALLAESTNWPQISLGGPLANPYYVVSCLLRNWTCIQEEGVRTADGGLLYYGRLNYEIRIHGALSSF